MAKVKELTQSPAQPVVDPHSIAVDEVARALSTDVKKGLSRDDVETRLQQYGPNSLPEKKGRTIFEAFLEQFANFLIILLLAASVLAAAIGEYLDAAAIVAIVVLSAVLGVAQEWRAEKAIQALRAMLEPTTNVMREGRVEEVPTASLVPGDLVLLAAGEHVPADLRSSKPAS
jgi:Ca2+-transporting ATPase